MAAQYSVQYGVPITVLRSSWVMTCAYSPSMNMVACGGLDNMCTLYELSVVKKAGPQKSQNNPTGELMHHEGYISSIRFQSARIRTLRHHNLPSCARTSYSE